MDRGAMSQQWSIRVEGLGKDYAPLKRTSGFFFRDLFQPKAKSPVFTALDDLSFTLNEGETLGIIGSNGAGKSTLLKILSQVTTPSRGRVEIRGRIAPLLEVGTGFHPDLSGRDNVYLNGSLLGMQRDEVRRVFDEIVAFSGVEEFIDQPVKHYSSGMYVRLAFAVAAHLRAEIMLVDEVLAVGDLAFQHKCLQKMEALSLSGRSVLLVSHQMENLLRLCQSALWLDHGRMKLVGSAETVAAAYRKTMLQRAEEIPAAHRQDRKGSGELQLQHLTLVNAQDEAVEEVYTHEVFRLQMEIAGQIPQEELNSLRIQLNVFNQDERFVGSFDSGMQIPLDTISGSITLITQLPVCPFYAGQYWMVARILLNGRTVDRVESVLRFEVKTGKDAWSHRKSGMRYSLNWEPYRP